MTLAYERLGRDAAIEQLRPFAPQADSAPNSELEARLRQDGIAGINLDISDGAFQELSDQYALCIDEHGEWLDWTAGRFDKDGVPKDGHVRKDLEMNSAGMQIKDPKNLFHFNNNLRQRWQDRSLPGSHEFRTFMDSGFEIQDALVAAARNLVTILDESYPGMRDFYFPRELSETTFRLLRYDGYSTRDAEGNLIVEQNAQVAKPHYDRGGMTIQAYASAPGFWRQKEGEHGERYPKYFPPHGLGQAQVFMGAEHRQVYGSRDLIKPLYHGVVRVLDEKEVVDYMPPRTAEILFIDTPIFDMGITSRHTQPERVDQNNLNV
jgi:hypothetical protein